MKSRFLNANGLRTHILEEGAGPLVLLAHGFPETSYSWRHQLSALAASGFHAVAPDMRGYGQTESPSETERYSVFDIVGDLVGLLDALNAPHAVIVGNDWGSTVAWQAALMRPDRFRGIAAIGVPMMGAPPLPPTRILPQSEDELHYTLYFQEPGIAETELDRDVATSLRKILFAASYEAGPRHAGDNTPNPFGMVARHDGLLASLPSPTAPPRWLAEEDFEVLVQAYDKTGFSGGLNYYRNLDANWHLQRSLAGRRVEIPALYMIGEQDTGLSMPGMRQIISDMGVLVPKLQKTVFLANCGHWAPLEQADRVSSEIIEFAQGL